VEGKLMFDVGDRVVLLEKGVASVKGFVARAPDGSFTPSAAGQPGAFLELALAHKERAFIPLEAVADLTRPLISKADAEAALETLRSSEGHRPADLDAAMREAIRSSSASIIATTLRGLYVRPQPAGFRTRMAIVTLEALLFGELSAVLGIERSTLETEMRQRYPLD
jgi:RNA polymerase-interacting CarD/CdnL/TRCF family regulator